MTWIVTPRQFHQSDYEKCIDMIQKIYFLHHATLENVVSMEAIQDLFGEHVSDVRLLLSSGKLATVLSYSLNATATIMGIVGRLKGQEDTGIVAFRGTKLVTEWLQNADFLVQVDLSKPQPKHPYSSVQPQPLRDFDPSTCPEGTRVVRGLYTLYTSFSGRKVQTKDSRCFCAQKCKKGRCKVVPNASTAKVDKPCKTSGTVTCSQNRKHKVDEYYDPSLQDQVLENVRELQSLGVRRWMVTGHSLGASLATLCSYHLTKLGFLVYGVYSVACPRIGNPTFARDYNTFIPYHYRSANLDDLVTQLPLPSVGNQLCYTHVGNSQFVFSDITMALSICDDKDKSLIKDAHSCSLYAMRHFRTKRIVHD